MFSSKRLRFTIINLSIIVLGGFTTVAAQTGTITGQVHASGSDSALTGANVLIPQLERGVSTDQAGQFVFRNIPPGTYNIQVSFIGYAQEGTESIQVNPGERVTVDIPLKVNPVEAAPLIVSANRSTERLSEVAGSVTLMSNAELESQTRLNDDMGSLLAQVTPGLAPGTGSLSNYGQPLRGRDLAVMIDGVPQSTPLRNVYRDLQSIDASSVQRVEVIRGANATYGYGATGGVVTIITKTPDARGFNLNTEIQGGFAPSALSESASARIRQGIQGSLGDIGFSIHGAFHQRGNFYDAEGDMIPPDPHGQGGLASSDEYNFHGSLNYKISDWQSLRVQGNYYNIKQDLSHVTMAGVPGETKATASADSVPGLNPGTENTVLSAQYQDRNFLGQRFTAKVYHQNYMTRFGYAGYFPDGGGQSFLSSEKTGIRIDVEAPLAALPGSSFLWGVDYLQDHTAQPLEDGRVFVPTMRQQSVAPFAQLKYLLTDKLLLRGGARYENLSLQVDDFVTLFGQNSVQGGTLNYSQVVFNGGAVAYVHPMAELFVSYSQGFSVADVGRELRGTSAGSVTELNPEAQIVDNYEVGVRGNGAAVRYSLSGFYNRSELGSIFGDAPEFNIVRSPERVYGLEGTVDLSLSSSLGFGATATILEGKLDSNQDGEFDTYLPGYRISPTKLTGHVTYNPSEKWVHRLQVLYSGSRDRFPGSTAFGEGSVSPYTVVDWLSQVNIGPGSLHLGVENLLNTMYFPVLSQVYNLGFGYSAGHGRRVNLGYSIEW